LSIRGNDNIGNEVIVSAKSTKSVSVRISLGIIRDGGLVGKTPYHDGLITGRREDKVGVLRGGSDAGYPVTVPGKGSAESHCFSHGWN